MDIGTLTGQAAIEDQLSDKLLIMAEHVKKFAEDFNGVMGAAAIGAFAVTAAVGGIVTSIIALGTRGSELNNVETGFNQLSGSVTNADEVLAAMRKGVVGTVDDWALMTQANKLMASGVHANAEDFGTLTSAARVLSREGFGPLETVMSQIDRAMQTGQTARLGRIGITVDLKTAESEYAKSLGLTVQQLNPLQLLEAKRLAILEAASATVAKAGAQELSFAEKIGAVNTAITNWMDHLEGAIAASTHVSAAFDAIKTAIEQAFGGASQTLFDTIVGWVNSFSDAVTKYAPPIIQEIGDIWYEVKILAKEVKDAWDLVPDWFKNIARDAGIAGVAVYLTSEALKGSTSSDVLSNLASLAQIWSVIGTNISKAGEAIQFWIGMVAAFKWEAVVLIWDSLAGAVAAFLGTSAGVAAIIVVVADAVYEMYRGITALYQAWKDGKPMWDFFGQGGGFWDHSMVGRWLGMSTDAKKMADAAKDFVLPSTGFAFPKEQVVNLALPPDAKLDAFDKKVQALFQTLTEGSQNVRVVSASFDLLSQAQLANSDVQQRLIPELDKLSNAHIGLTAKMQDEYSVALASEQARVQQEESLLSMQGVTLGYIEIQKKLGLSEQNIATLQGVSVKGLQEYEKKLQEVSAWTATLAKLTDAAHSAEMANTLTGPALQTTKLDQAQATEVRPYQAEFDAEKISAQQLADAKNLIAEKYIALNIANTQAEEATLAKIHITSLDTIEKSYVDFAEKNKQLTLTGTGLQIEQIEVQRKAMIAGLGARTDANALFWDNQKVQIDAFYGHEIDVANKTAGTLEQRLHSQGILTKTEMARQTADFLTDYEEMVFSGNHTSDQLSQAWQRYVDSTKGQSSQVVQNWHEAWESIKKDLNAVLISIPGTIASAFTGGGGLLGAVKSIGSSIGSIAGKSIAAAMSFAGPMGQAIGSAIGSLAGPLISLFANLFDHVGHDFKKMGQDMGINFSKGLIDQLKADTKLYGGEMQATLVDLAKIIQEAGGLTTTNLSMFTQKLHDVFTLVGTHQLTIAAGAKILDDNFSAFVTSGTNKLGILDAKLVDIIKLNDQFGTQSKAISDYTAGQATNAQTGFTAALTVTGDAYTTLADLQTQAAKATGQTLDDLNAKMKVQQGIIDATKIHSQAAASAVASSLVGIVAANMQAGMTFIAAIRAVSPSVQALQKQLQAAGYAGGAAFDFINQEVTLANDAIAGPALTSINGFTAGMVGLSNAGLLNQETFSGLSSQIAGTEAALVAQGFSGKTVMTAMQGDLQTVWELQQQYNFSLDSGTQALVDQAKADGLVGETHKSTTQQMLDASNRMVDVLEAMATFMGVTLPKAAETGAKGVQGALDGIHAPSLTIDVGYNMGALPEPPQPLNPDNTQGLASGGIVQPRYMAVGGMVPQYAATGATILPFRPRGTDTVPAMLTPGEEVKSVVEVQAEKDQQQPPQEVNNWNVQISVSAIDPQGLKDIVTRPDTGIADILIQDVERKKRGRADRLNKALSRKAS